MINTEELHDLIEYYYESIFDFCLSRVNYNITVAEDITQDVFLFACKKSDVLIDNNLKSWLYSVVQNKIHEYFNKLKKENHLELKTVTIYDNVDHLTFNYSNESYISDISEKKIEIIKNLDEEDKYLIKLRYVDEKRYMEISEILNVTEASIKMRYKRLRKRMNDILDKYKEKL